MREFFSTIFHAGEGPQGRGEAARLFARFAVLGAFVLGVAPGGGWAALAQARKTGGGAAATTDSGVKKTAKSEAPKGAAAAKTEGPKSEGTKVSIKPIKAFLARSKRLHEEGRLDLSKPHSLLVV